MCWCVNKINFIEKPNEFHKTATEDIVVYKFGYVKDEKFYPFVKKDFFYKPNIINEEIKLVLIDYLYNNYYWHRMNKMMIEEGYHSYNNRGICSLFSRDYILDYASASHFGKFIIPKGTEYYENKQGEIVSSQIMWTGEYKQNIPLNMEDIIKNINKKILK